jgi:hypothetical protein
MDQPERPRAAEWWARTALHRAGGVTVVAAGGSAWTPLHAVDPTGAVVLVVPAGDRLVAATRVTAVHQTRLLRSGVAAVMEVREESPLPLPCPVRVRTRLEGRLRVLAPDEARSAALEIATRRPADELFDVGTTSCALELRVDRAELVASDPQRARERPLTVTGSEWAAAGPDLFADEEALHLVHLAEDHQPALAMLRWALEPELRRRAGQLVPAPP